MCYALLVVVLIAVGMYWYNKIHYLAYSEICEGSQLSKFVWASRTYVQNRDGSLTRVFGYSSKDNEQTFYIYLDADDPRVQEFEKKDELLAFVDYQYIKDYFIYSKEKSPFRILGKTPFAMASKISCVDYPDVDIFDHVYFSDCGSYIKCPFSKEMATNILKGKIGMPTDMSKLLYNKR